MFYAMTRLHIEYSIRLQNIHIVNKIFVYQQTSNNSPNEILISLEFENFDNERVFDELE